MRLLPRLLSFLVAPLLVAPLTAQAAGPGTVFDPDDFFDARIHDVGREGIVRLTMLGVDVQSRQGDDAIVYLTEERYRELEGLGYHLTVLPRAGRNGARVGYTTFAQLTTQLQAVAAAYPSICRLHDIGTSVQGRELWFLQISDNVTVEENEPEFKYISSIHGDEVVGIELCLELIDLLTTQYGTDPQITRLVNETEIWIMPMMNPDGRTNGSRYNSQGYDLNREFPDRVNDANNSVTGRPKEVRHVMNWGFAHSPVLSANFHGGAKVVNYPYDSDPNPWTSYSACPDDALVIEQSLTYSRQNLPMFNSPWFNNGITNGVAWYLIYGGMQDWNYVWQGCNDVTIELDDAKWPAYSRIAGLWNDNRESMLAYMDLCLTGVRGLVTNIQTGAPLAATVRVSGINHDVYTDPDVGDYHRMVLPGTYSLVYSAPGFVSQTISGIGVGSGDATVVDVALVPNGFTPPQPDIKINGQDGPLTVSSSQSVAVTISLTPGDLPAVAHDWWIRATDGVNTYWWTFPSNWNAATTRCYNGGLLNLPFFPVASGQIPVGTWTFTFAVDALDNAYQGNYADSVTITSF